MSTQDVKILTRRLVHSSVVKLIFSARIRHEEKNDVLFIGENYVAIKELFQDGSLEDVGILADFESNIMSARVYGIVKQPEPPLEFSALSPSIKPEDTESGSPTVQEIPPQILVLALDSSSLVFLSAHPDPANLLGFMYHQQPLFDGDTYTKRSGKHMAVDPESRALAVAAHEGHFTVYSLKLVSQLRREFRDTNAFKPIIDGSEQNVLVKGIILQMDFLYPPAIDPDLVILILLVRSKDKTYLQRYEWDFKGSTSTIKREDSHPLEATEQLPLLLIPFEKSPGFMLIFEDSVTTRGNILADWCSPHHRGQMFQYEPPEEPGSCRQRPLWTQWARPIRRKGWNETGEVIYLCREDGLVTWLELEGEAIRTLPHNIGRLGINVSTAFTSLDSGRSYYDWEGSFKSQDFLVAGGDMSEGGLFSLTPHHPAKKQQPIANWAPLTGLVVSNEHAFVQDSTVTTRDIIGARQRVFAGVGKGSRQGAICEIRYGIPALSSTRIPINALGSIGIRAMWVFVLDGRVLLLVTDPERSYVLEFEDETFDSIKDAIDEKSPTEHGLDMEARTITAGSTAQGQIIQIMEQSIRISAGRVRPPLIKDFGEEMTITAASIEGTIPALLIVVRYDNQFSLRLLDGNRLASETESQILLSCEPSCVLLRPIGDHLYAFVGMLNGLFQVFQVDGGDLSLSFQRRFEGDFAICDSIGLISETTKPTDEVVDLVLCGLRNGSLHILQLEHINDSAECILKHCETLNIGNTSVTVLPDVTSISADNERCSRAILACKETLCRLEYRPNQRHTDAALVNSVWLIDNNEPAFQHGALKAVAQLDAWQLGNLAARYLFCIEREDLHIAIPETPTNPRILPRRWKVDGTPYRLVYSKTHDKLIVGFTEVIVQPNLREKDDDVQTGKRVLYPMLGVMDHNADFFTQEKGGAPAITSKAIGHSGEKILGLLDWFPKRGQTPRNFLVVHTLRQNRHPKKDDGRILLYRLVHHEGILTTDLEQVVGHEDCPGPVFAMAPYGNSSLVYCSGDVLKLRRLDMSSEAIKWEDLMEYNLQSQARSISTQEPYIYVITQDQSLQILRVRDDKIVPHSTDKTARNGLSHLQISEHSLFMVSDEAQRVAGLQPSANVRLDNSIETIFQASLPVAIAHFLHGPIQPPWYTRRSENPRAIVGCSLDGSFYQFEIINNAQWWLLRVIQDLAQRNQILSPFTFDLKKPMKPAALNAPKAPTHVNGDILLRLLERGRPDPESLLETMLRGNANAIPGSGISNIASNRMNKFAELSENALGPLNGRDPVEATVEFLRRILQAVL